MQAKPVSLANSRSGPSSMSNTSDVKNTTWKDLPAWECPGLPRKVPHATPCNASARYSWTPDEWTVPSATGARPNVTNDLLERLCEGLAMHVADPSWAQTIRSPATYERLFDIRSEPRTDAERRGCVEALQSFQPRVCSLPSVFVTSSAKRMFDDSAYYVPKRSWTDLRGHDCMALRRVGGCAEHVALARNPLGVAFYHTMYDTFGGLAYLLEHLRSRSGSIKILENRCNVDHDTAVKEKYSRETLRACTKGILPFFAEMAAFLGVNATTDMVHYPYGRQVHGSSFYVERATFECSDSSSFRDFWHAIKLRRLLLARFDGLAPPQRAIVVIDRNSCNSARAKLAGCSWTGRGVHNQAQITNALQMDFGRDFEVVVFQGGGMPFASQAALMRRAAAVVGPHGAALANLIFCQPATRVVEYLKLPHFPLYAGYANMFELQYWPVLDPTRQANYGGIHAPAVQRVVECALAAEPSLLGARASRCPNTPVRLVLNSEHLLLQSSSREGWTSFNRRIDGYGSPQPW